MPITLTTRSPDETFALGRWLGERLEPGMVVGLDGTLGAGKTWLAKGLVAGVADGPVDETLVKSPAYNLVHEYDVPRRGSTQRIVHIDFYRLDTLSDTDFLLMGEVFDQDGALYLVEWAQRFLVDLVPDFLSIIVEPGEGDTTRTLTLSTVGRPDRYATLLDEVSHRADPGA